MKPIDPARRIVVNVRSPDASYVPNVHGDGLMLGDSILRLDSSLPLGVGFHIHRMPDGMSTRPHRHNGPEQFLVLEGELIDHDGTVYRSGALVLLDDGTEHRSFSPDGCLLAVHLRRAETNLDCPSTS